MVGSLNLLSIAFAVLFVGLGVDFGIQFSVRYRSERFKNDDLALALESAASRSAVPLSLAAMATAAGFLCFLPTDYKGISELGKIAGAGMMIAFITSITVLPAHAETAQSARRERAGRLRVPGAGGRIPRKASRHHHRRHAAGRRGRSAAALFPEVRLQPDQPAQSEGRIDRDLPRSAQGSQHRRQRHQRADQFGSRGEEDRGAAGESAGSPSRDVARQFRARGSAGEAEADRAGRQGGGARAQSRLGRCGAHGCGECRGAEELGRQPAQEPPATARGRARSRRGGWRMRCRSLPSATRRRATRRRTFSSPR